MQENSLNGWSMEASQPGLVEQKERRLFQVPLPDIGKTGHSHAIDDTMIRRPANTHDVCLDNLILVIEARHRLRTSHCTNGHLGRHYAGMCIRAAHLEIQE